MLKLNLSIFLFFLFITIFINSSQAKKIGTVTKQPNIKLPAELTIPDGNKFKFLLFASGIQIYECTDTNTFKLVEPIAELVNVKNQAFKKKNFVAHHFFRDPPVPFGTTVAKASWRSSINGDNSLVTTGVIAQVAQPSPNIPWLLTKTAVTDGTGAFSDITHVLRVATEGGIAPDANQCGAGKKFAVGEKVSIPYKSQYWFINAK